MVGWSRLHAKLQHVIFVYYLRITLMLYLIYKHIYNPTILVRWPHWTTSVLPNRWRNKTYLNFKHLNIKLEITIYIHPHSNQNYLGLHDPSFYKLSASHQSNILYHPGFHYLWAWTFQAKCHLLLKDNITISSWTILFY